MDQILIRTAAPNDIPQIFSLVQELAAYENAPQEVWTNEEIYARDFANNAFHSLVAVDGDAVIGTCIFYPSYSTWKGRMLYLEDFIVQSSHRRKGIGQILFDAFLDYARQNDYNLVKWEVLDWNEPAINFYQKNHAQIKKNWWDGIILLKDRRKTD